jgi:hypothetical protein
VAALIALALAVGAAFFFAQDLVGSSDSADADGEQATAESVETTDEAEQPEDDPSERIVAARAVESAGQIVQSANSAARTVVELAPNAPSRDSEATSGARAPDNGRAPEDEQVTGASKTRTESGNAPDLAASGSDTQTSDEASAAAEETSDETTASKQGEDEALSDIAEETVAEPETTNQSGESTDQRSESKEAFKVAPLAPDDEKSEADSSGSASSSTSATGGTESTDGSRRDSQPSSSDSSEVASESDSEPSDDKDEASDEDTSKEERETRSAPVSF